MNNKILTIPNIITLLRIFGTFTLLFIKTLTIPFFIIYAVAGVSDAIDGTVARITKTVSDIGARLDSVADLFFYAVMLLKIFPILWEALPRSIWILVALILLARVLFYLIGFIKTKALPSNHTILNKLTGFMLFSVPFVINLIIFAPFCWGICLISSIGSLEDLITLLGNKKGSNQKVHQT